MARLSLIARAIGLNHRAVNNVWRIVIIIAISCRSVTTRDIIVRSVSLVARLVSSSALSRRLKAVSASS